MFDKLFGRKKPPPPPPRDVSALTRGLAVPAAQAAATQAAVRSHLGGVPELPAAVEWPAHDGQRLDFLARIELTELQATVPIEWLPPSGALLFFYDAQEQPWGFDPGDRGRWAVLHVGDGAASSTSSRLAGPGQRETLPRVGVAFRRVDSYPSWERGPIAALGLTHVLGKPEQDERLRVPGGRGDLMPEAGRDPRRVVAEHDHRGLGIAHVDPVHREEDGGCAAAIERLDEHMRPARGQGLQAAPPARREHHERPLRWAHARGLLECAPERGRGPRDDHGPRARRCIDICRS
jgi:hypothetical protein